MHTCKLYSAVQPSHLDPIGLERLRSAVRCAVVVFRNFGYEGDLSSFENLRRVVQKLPPELKQDWGKSQHPRPTEEPQSYGPRLVAAEEG